MDRQEATQLVNALFDSWYPRLFRYACRLTSSVELAEDLVQEAFMELYKELAKGRTVNNPKAWTLCVLRREVQRHVRTHGRRERAQESLEVLETLPAGATGPDLGGLYFEEVESLFSSLSPREEEVLLLRLEALKYREIGERLGISANSVTTLLSRALKEVARPGRRGAGRAAVGLPREDGRQESMAMNGEHCSDEQLLALLDGESGMLEKLRVTRHIEACWECRGRLAELDRQVHAVAEAVGQEPFPQRHIDRARQRFLRWEAAAGIEFRRPARAWRYAAVAVAAILLLVAGWMVRLSVAGRGVKPAGVVLAEARRAEAPALSPHVVTRQVYRVEVRGWGRAAEASHGKLEVYAAAGQERYSSRWLDSAGTLCHAVWRPRAGQAYSYSGRALERLRRSGGQETGMPAEFSTGPREMDAWEEAFRHWLSSRRLGPLLLAEEFAALAAREGLNLDVESVRASNGAELLRLVARRDGEKRPREVVLLIEARTYRSVALSVRMGDARRTFEFTLRLEAAEVLAPASVDARVFQPDPALSATRSSARLKPGVQRREAPATAPAERTPDSAEFEALYALHRGGFCLGEPVEIVRGEDGAVEIHGLAGSSGQAEEWMAPLQPLIDKGWVRWKVRSAAEFPIAGQEAHAEPPQESVAALRLDRAGAAGLRKLMLEHFRHPGEATNEAASRRWTDYSNGAVTLADTWMAEAYAIRRLLNRFPPEVPERRDPAAQALLHQMLADHVRALAVQMRHAHAVLAAPLLRPAEAGQEESAIAPEAAAAGWAESLMELFGALESTHALVHGLFAGAGLPAGTPEQSAARLLAGLESCESRVVRSGNLLAEEPQGGARMLSGAGR